MTHDPLAGRRLGAPDRNRMLVATEDGVFLWPAITLVERRGNSFFAMEPRDINNVIGAFFGPDALRSRLLTVLESARDQLRLGQYAGVQLELDRLLLPPVSTNGVRLMRAFAARHELAIPDVAATTEQSGTTWRDRDIDNFVHLHDDLRLQARALQKTFNPGSAWNPAKHPRWPSGESDGGRFRPGDGAGGGGTSPILPAAAKKPPRRPWERHANPTMRQKLAELESSADKPNNGYGERNKSTNALGRYQLLKKALIDAGWKNSDGSWSEKAKEAGVTSDAQFLKNPEAQEKALTDLLQKYTKELTTNGAYAKIGSTVQDSAGDPIRVTEAGLLAAAHKEGPKAVKEYLDPTLRASLRAPQIRNIEHRLREAADTPYDAAAAAREANTKRRGPNAKE